MQANVKGNFVYQWTDSGKDMIYIGVHKGTDDDGYICSQKRMLTEYYNRPQDFTREILSYHITYEEARAHEIEILTRFNAAADSRYYNRHNGGSIGFRCEKHSEETKQKLRKHSKAIAHRNILTKTGNKYFLGRKHSEETKKKISEKAKARPGKPHSEETIKRMSISQKGRKKTPEHKEKLRLANLGKSLNYETRLKMSISRTGRKNTPQTKEKMRQSALIREQKKRDQNG